MKTKFNVYVVYNNGSSCSNYTTLRANLEAAVKEVKDYLKGVMFQQHGNKGEWHIYEDGGMVLMAGTSTIKATRNGYILRTELR